MSIVTWIEDKKRQKVLNAPKYVNPAEDSNKGLWTRCDKCGVILYIKHLKENQRVCFGCSYHLQMSSQERIDNLLDKSSWRPLDETLSPCDPLEFHDQKNYTDRLQDAQERTGLQDAIQTGTGMIDGIPVALGVMDFSFMGGSMGSVVGEKITRLIEYASQEGLTLLIVCASGGARMQEGVFSLMQMAKISSALQIYQSHANLLYISIITSPTTGGVTASFAMLGDIIFAEPKALIAFAGRRVIEQTLREDLPDDFQTSEYMLHHGLVDLIVPRRFLRQALSESIRLYQNAPFKRPGRIPFGVQNPISFLTEEKVRRKWGTLTDQNFDIKTITKKPVSLGTNVVASRNGMQKVDSQGLQSKALHSRNLVNSQKSSSKAELCYTLQDQDLLEQDLFDKTRQSMEYRDILTSFEMMFNLFSKESYIPDSLNSDKTSTNESEAYQSLCKASPCKTSSFLLSSLRNVSSYPQKALFSKKLGRSFYQNNGAHKQVVEKSNKAVFGLSPKSLQVQAKQGLPLPEGSHRHSSHSLNSIHLKRVLTKERDKFLPEIPFLNSPKSVLRLYPNIVQVHIQKPLFVFHPQSRKIKAIDSDSTFRFESSLTKRSCLHLNHSKLGTSIERVKRTREPSVVLAIQALRKQSPPKDKLEGAKQKTALGKIAALARTFPQQRVHTKLTNAQQSFARRYEQAIDSPNGTSPFLDLGFVVSPLPKTGSSQNVFYRNLQKKVEQTFIKVVSKRGDVLPEESNSNGDHRNIQELYSSSSGAQNGASHKLLLHSFRSLSETESFLSKQDDKRSNLGSPPLQNKSLQTDTQLKSLQKQHKSMLTNRSSVGMKLLDLIALNTTELAQNSFASSSADALCPAYSRQDLTKQNFVGTNQDSSASKNLPKEYKTDGFAKQNQETDIDFLNQAIEMAATESVEWKAFYLHQRLSKTTGFLEDFIKPVLDVQVEKDRNLLLYRSICRKSKQVDL